MFYFDEFTITKREIIASISIICIFLVLGILISGKMQQKESQQLLRYEQAIQIEDPAVFAHGMDTSIGDAFIYGEIISNNPVSSDKLNGQYMLLREEEEHYEMHTRVVSNGKTCHSEVYYTWDHYKSVTNNTDTINFLGRDFDFNLFASKCNANYIDTIRDDSDNDIRYVYYGIPVTVDATVFGVLSEGTIKGDIKVFEHKSIEGTLKSIEASPTFDNICFWIFWVLLTGFIVFVFYYLDNNWLNN